MWVTARRDVLERAVEKNMFARAAKAGVRPAADLPGTVADLLARRCIELLSLANRAGLAVAGYEKASAALRAGKAALLLTAADSTGQDAAALRRSAGDKAAPAVLTAAEQGQVFGREASVNVAVRPGALTSQLRRELYRLAGFRQTDAETDANMPRQVNG
jgi:ribosomal protein L7Ae-like RNA K-turn-binding protein